MKTFFVSFLLFFNVGLIFCQNITGTVTNPAGETLPDVNIYLENSFTGTTSNAEGKYVLQLKQPLVDEILIFQYLGFKTERISLQNIVKDTLIDVVLSEEITSLEGIVVEANENPAIKIIQETIKNRKKNSEKPKAYTAEFYSRSLWKAENIPEKILGREVGDFEGTLDSTRSGIIYLSETFSNIYYQAPQQFKEEITASKVSGSDNGFSWNNAEDFNVSFYENTISFNIEMISPIADYAFNYYDYQLEGVFYDSHGFLINKVKVIPRREKDKVFQGYMYIVDETWEIYGIDLSTTGEATQIPPLETLRFQQEFSYDSEQQVWLSLSKGFFFTWKIFGMSGSGKFLGFYKNYDLQPPKEKLKFTKEIVSYQKDANKRDSVFWQNNRPIPLTEIEQKDYLRKDSIQTLRKSKSYLDSIDQVKNKFKVLSPIQGYTWENSYKNRSISYEGFSLKDINYNNVQGWHVNTSFQYLQKDEDNSFKRYWNLIAAVNYGFSEEKVRGKLTFRRKFNNFKDTFVSISAGSEAVQVNNMNPISPLINTFAATFYERSFIKLYERNFAEVFFSEEITNGIRAFASLAYEDRRTLNNTTSSRIWVNNPDGFTSNHPLQPNLTGEDLFINHHIGIAKVGAILRFGQTYILRPDGKYNLPNQDYPSISLVYEKGFGSSYSNYHFESVKSRIEQDLNLANWGVFNYQINMGWINNQDEQIAFLDYKHFNGNQTFIETANSYVGRFLLMDYYGFSTQNEYAELHVEHQFKGLLMNKIPLINQLNYNLVVGAKSLFTQERSPYYEIHAGLENLGFGKFRFLRIDYVQSFHQSKTSGGIMLGLQFLNFL